MYFNDLISSGQVLVSITRSASFQVVIVSGCIVNIINHIMIDDAVPVCGEWLHRYVVRRMCIYHEYLRF